MKEWRMDRLKEKVALVSGAAAGIGAAIARAFVSEGAWVAVTDIADERGRELAATLGSSSEYYRLDVRQETEWSTVIDHILHVHGKLDVVVNNAGITGFEGAMVPHDPEHAALADWRAVLTTNLDGTFLGCKHALRAMRSQQGSLQFDSSSCHPHPDVGAHAG
jgi:NAD(P)-dependent dehydrogenase (short-subunit alcohol dehydrogenase family)